MTERFASFFLGYASAINGLPDTSQWKHLLKEARKLSSKVEDPEEASSKDTSPVPDVMTVSQFCVINRISRATFYNLKAVGRAPDTTTIGGKVIITTDAAASWRRAMAQNPVNGGLRLQAEAAKASRGVPAPVGLEYP